MDLIFKTIAAFCVGVGIMYGVQTFYVKWIMESVASNSSNPMAS